ncbi:MAG: hypothetical protein IJM58_08020 [Muribaculaceae bacterium]|nr:hypothetical protein [Muribaculaceae bacterium]
MRVKELLLLALALFTLLPISGQSVAGPDGSQNRDRIIFGGSAHEPRLIDIEPEGWYYYNTRMITIEFPATDFEPYTLTVETVLTTQEYYVTTPFVSQYISPDVVNVNLYLETDGGDLYWGSFEATDYTSME